MLSAAQITFVFGHRTITAKCVEKVDNLKYLIQLETKNVINSPILRTINCNELKYSDLDLEMCTLNFIWHYILSNICSTSCPIQFPISFFNWASRVKHASRHARRSGSRSTGHIAFSCSATRSATAPSMRGVAPIVSLTA